MTMPHANIESVSFFTSIIKYFEESTAYQYGVSAKEALSFYGEKLKLIENSGQLYKVVPLALGTYFGYQSLKSFARGTIGYDSWDARKKLISKATDQKELPYNEKLTLIRDAFFGSMKGKQRAFILAKGIVNALITGALLYPFFAMTPKPTIDLEQRASTYPHDKDFLDSQIMRRNHDHNLDVAAEIYHQQEPIIRQAILDPKMDPKTIAFAETINPNLEPISNSFKTNLRSACDWTLGWTSYNTTCASLPISNYHPMVSIGEDGSTMLNANKVGEICSNPQPYLNNSVPSLSAQAGDLFETACDYTLGYTPWSSRCKELRTFIAPSSAERANKISLFMNKLCGDLQQRVQLQDSYNVFFKTGPKALELQQKMTEAKAYLSAPLIGSYKNGMETQLTSSQNEVAQLANAIKMLGESTFKGTETINQSAQTILGLIGNQHPKNFQEVARQFMNITEPGDLNEKIVKQAYREMQRRGHPDKTADMGQIEKAAAGKTLMETFKEHPNLYTGRTTYTLEELGKMFLNFFNKNLVPNKEPTS